MKPRPWRTALWSAVSMTLFVTGMLEVRAKQEEYGLNPFVWPIEITSFSDPSMTFFILTFLVPAAFAMSLAIARHGQDEAE